MTKQKNWFYLLLLAIIAALIIAVVILGNRYRSAQRINVCGTFCTDPESQWNAQFLTLDMTGNYSNYANGNTICEGTYSVNGRIIALTCETGALSAVYADNAIYLFGASGSDVTAYFRISDSAIYSN